MPKKKVKLTEPKRPAYFFSLDLGGVISESESDSIIEGLSALQYPYIIKTKGVLVVRKGTLKSEIRLTPFQVKKMKISKYFRIIQEKRIENLLK